ncbi:MAG: GNAT family N-acetyltransferase [Enterobacter sp.]|nr:GNAT family N-acetyltransferase [Enterobacter sp.]
MAIANIVHSGYGFHCTATDRALPLALGLDGSAVLERLKGIPDGWLVEALDQLFVAAPALTGITLPWADWQDEPQAQALFGLAHGDYLARDAFWQLPLWLKGERPQASGGMQFDESRQLYFPLRPRRPQGEVYRRYDPQIKRTLSFRVADVALDGERFTRWMNNPRVNAFWETFGYFELYWAPEDRIGRHYRWQPFDRGLHMLVGEENWRGAQYIRSWLRGLSHYLYLDEPRTTRIVAEPRFDNQRLFRHLDSAGFDTVKEFDFPHKRSRLIMSQRHRFFSEVGL